jgi:hypothetical protein
MFQLSARAAISATAEFALAIIPPSICSVFQKRCEFIELPVSVQA